jgi:hypothetical protein
MHSQPINTSTPLQVQLAPLKASLALLILLFLTAATLPYTWLIAHFGYDDILREPGGAILAKFHAGGPALVLAWFTFAMSALLFVPVAMGFERLLSAHWTSGLGAQTLGIASAIAQATGLLRWVLVVPGLAGMYVAPGSSENLQQTLGVVFDAVHRYGGMVLGEMVGQLLLAGWTALVALQLLRSAAVPRWIARIGLLTVPLWLLGQSELLHMVVPAVRSIEVIPVAFMAWEAWLLLIAMYLGVSAWKERHAR